MDWDINVLLSQDENLGYWWSTGFGFKSLCSFIFEWCYFRKNGLTENFCHRKGSWKPPKTTQLCWLAVTKPLDQNLIMRYQRKEDIHIFYLIPCDAKYLYYSGHTDHFYNQGPNGKWKNGEWYVHIVRGPWLKHTCFHCPEYFEGPSRPYLLPCLTPPTLTYSKALTHAYFYSRQKK